jgi:hypothetical protein
MSGDKRIETFFSSLDETLHFVIQRKLEFRGCRKRGSGRLRTGRAEVSFTRSDGGKHEFIHAQGRRAVHAAMLTQEAGPAVLEDDHWSHISSIYHSNAASGTMSCVR